MIAYLPEIYPDELVYSWFCRYYIHTGCITHTMAFRELLYNRCNNPSKEFIGHLNPDTVKLIQRLFVMDDLIKKHTMYPQYARFIPLQQKENALYHIGYDFCDAHHLFAILPRTQADGKLKYCPLCVQEDRKNYGEAYWHRKHQIRNMSICTKHKCLLVDSTVTAKSEQTFILNPAETTVEIQEPQYSNNTLQVAFCEYMAAVFDAPINLDSDIPISAVLYHAMSKTKYMKQSGKSRYTKQFVDDMQIYYNMVNINSLKEWQKKHLNYITKPKFLGNPALVFGNLELDFDTHFKPILSHNKDDEIFYLDRNEYQLQYWITNNGKVFDSDVGVYLKPDIKNTYYYVNLKKSKSKYEHVYIHYLVAYYFCKGWLNKEEVHHIDKNPLNNNYKNLIWVTHAEHMELHSLFETDKKAYRKRIREIRKENSKW